jgi:hypothetical protein
MKQVRKHQIEGSIVEKAYLLSALILAQYDIEALKHPANEHWCMFSNDFEEKFHENFMKELIGFTGLLRALLDIHLEVSSEKNVTNQIFDLNVGTLIVGEVTIPLDFRQACHKIIHAITYDIELKVSKMHPLDNGKNGYGSNLGEYKNPLIITYGKLGSKSWISELNLLKFMDLAINLED